MLPASCSAQASCCRPSRSQNYNPSRFNQAYLHRVCFETNRHRPSSIVGPGPFKSLANGLEDTKISRSVSTWKVKAAGAEPAPEAETQSQGIPHSSKPLGGPPGYTPFEYVTFGDNQLTHELSIEVESPVAILYAAWRAQRNYGEWLDIIGHTILHKDDDDVTSFFMYYQWGHLPPLELYVTLTTAVDDVNRELYLEAVDGFPLAVCALFEVIGSNRSKLSLRVAYQMPANLDMYVGPAGVWGDVNDILQSGLHVMKEQVEAGTAVFDFF